MAESHVNRRKALEEEFFAKQNQRLLRQLRETTTLTAQKEALAAALGQREHAKARAAFDAFSPSHRREYAEWIAEAKTDATRQKRLAQTLEQLAEGKSRHWKYQRA